MRKQIRLYNQFPILLWNPYYNLTRYWPHESLMDLLIMRDTVIEDFKDKVD